MDVSIHDDELYYAKEDIEILRNKLIEDILNYLKEEYGYDKTKISHVSYVVKEIINKRFGVNDKA